MAMDDASFTSHPHASGQTAISSANVGESERWPSMIAGALLTLFGLSRRSLMGLLLAAIGGWLVYRGATAHCPVYQTLGISTTDIEQQRTDKVAVKPDRHERVEEASWESFPASDSPSWTGGAIT